MSTIFSPSTDDNLLLNAVTVESVGHQKRLPRFVFCATQVKAHRRARLWRALLKPVAMVHCPASDSPVESLIAYDFAHMRLAQTTVSDGRYVRDSARIEHKGYNRYIMICLLLRGSMRGRFGSAAIELAQGDACFLDLAHDADLQLSEGQSINLVIPHEALGGLQFFKHGYILRQGRLVNRMLTRHLLQLVDILPYIGVEGADVAAKLTLDVVRASFILNRSNSMAVQEEALRTRVLSYIDTHLDDVELVPATLQSVFGLSRAHLYRMFTHSGGVQRYILEKRLDAVFEELSANPEQSISTVIYRLGFSGERQFQRGFRKRFGMTSSDLCRSASVGRPGKSS